MSLLKEHLASPKYLEYHIFFTNVVPHAALQDLADKDNKGVVKQVQVRGCSHLLPFFCLLRLWRLPLPLRLTRQRYGDTN